MFNIKLEDKSYKCASKLYRLKYSGQKTGRGCGGGGALRPPPLPPGHIGLIDLLRSSDCLKTVTCNCSSLIFDKKADNSSGNSSENFAF